HVGTAADAKPGPRYRRSRVRAHAPRTHLLAPRARTRRHPEPRSRYPPEGAFVSAPRLNIVILGLTVTSSWGNGHATTYRGLMRELVRRGHRVTFLERDMPWYADNRDLPKPPYGRTVIYASMQELRRRWSSTINAADVIILGSS